MALVAVIIAAPLVDARTCDGCMDDPTGENRSQHPIDQDCLSDCMPTSSATGAADPEREGATLDLCPLCANSAVALSSLFCGAPPMTCDTYDHPKLLAFSEPSFSIIKPPQN